MAKINLPQQLVRFVNGEIVEIDAPTVGELFVEFINRYPVLEKRLLKEDGSFNSFVNIYVNDEDIRFLNGKNTTLKATDDITIVPSTAAAENNYSNSVASFQRLVTMYRYLETTTYSRKLNRREFAFGKD